MRGLGLGLVCAVVYAVLAGASGSVFVRLPVLRPLSGLLLGSLVIIGVVQFIYIGPLAARASQAGRPNEAKGLMTAAGVVILLNATCWVVVLKSFR